MPSYGANVPEQGFRSSLFGFEKSDVLAYIKSLAEAETEREQQWQEESDRLRERHDRVQQKYADAQSSLDSMQGELNDVTSRCLAAEKERDALRQRLQELEQTSADQKARCGESQRAAQEWQSRCKELEQKLDAMKAAETPMPMPVNVSQSLSPENARIEARRILMDAQQRVTAAERQLAQQGEEQKKRMAENAEQLKVGMAVLRERLKRVDARLGEVSHELEDATAAIYEALDQTGSDLSEFSASLEGFGEIDIDAPEQGARYAAAPKPAKTAAQKVKAHPVHKNQPARPAAANRLRHSRGTASQGLQYALDRLNSKI